MDNNDKYKYNPFSQELDNVGNPTYIDGPSWECIEDGNNIDMNN